MRKTPSATFFLRIPEQDLKELQITNSNSKEFANWIQQLPKGHTGETARKLYQCVQELNRVEFTAKKRFYMLETLRPHILQVCSLLEKHYLNQPLIISDTAKTVANLSMALQNHLITGYKIVALHGCNKRSDKEYSRIVTTAIHRAISDSGKTLVRSYQLYRPVSLHTWHEIYQLYSIAEHYKLKNNAVSDDENKIIKETSISTAFCRCLLLSTSRPNQLRQQEIAKLYDATENWAHFSSIELNAEPPGTFTFDLLSDAPPNYHNWIATDSNTQLRVLVLKELVSFLEEYQKNPTDPDIPFGKDPDFSVPKGLSKHLLSEVIYSWSYSVDRTFDRTSTHGLISVCLGLKTTHYFTSGEKEFEELINVGLGSYVEKTRENPFLNSDGTPFNHDKLKEEKTKDGWSYAFDGGESSFNNGGNFGGVDTSNLEHDLQAQKNATKIDHHNDYIIHLCELVDVSPGGYCLEWHGKIPSQVRTGEILGIREDSDDKDWAIGVIRWASQISPDRVRVGIELLAPNAIACGAQIIPKTGEPSDFIRALQLPELKAINQDSTILTPAIAFHPGYKINVNCDGLIFKAQLISEIASTAAFSLFSFKILNQQSSNPEALASNEGIDDNVVDIFDNIWKKL